MAQRVLISDHMSPAVRARWAMPMATVAAVLTKFSHDLLASPWGISMQVLRSRTGRIDGEMVFVDNSDVAGALGYHELSPDGNPYGIVAVGTTLDARADPMVTATHEWAEMGGDMDASALAETETSGRFQGVAYELCDPVEADADGYNVTVADGSTHRVSNFVWPDWFSVGTPGPWDQRGLLTAPLTLRRGGYMAKFDPSRGWTQVFASEGDGRGMSFRAVNTTRIRRRAARAATQTGPMRSSFLAALASGEGLSKQEVAAGALVL